MYILRTRFNTDVQPFAKAAVEERSCNEGERKWVRAVEVPEAEEEQVEAVVLVAVAAEVLVAVGAEVEALEVAGLEDEAVDGMAWAFSDRVC